MRHRFGRLFLLAFLASSTAALLAAPLAGEEIPLRGKVVAGGQPVAGALVRLTAVPSLAEDFELRFSGREPAELARTPSGPDGAFTLAGPSEGFYRLVAAAPGQMPAESFLFLDPLKPAVQEIRLIPARSVSLTVLGPDGPIAGARIRSAFQRQQPLVNWPAFVATGADGKGSLQIGRDFPAEVWVVADGFTPQPARFAPKDAGIATVTLAPGPALAVVVTAAPRGRPLEGVAVLATASGVALGRTGADGKVLVRVPPGEKELGFADAAGRRGRQALPTAPPADGAPQRVELEDPLLLRGQVLELPGRTPLAGAWLEAPGRLPLFTRSRGDGGFELTVPRWWTPMLKTRKSGFRTAGTLVPERPAELAIALSGAARLAGRVHDSAGAAIAGAEVSLRIAGIRVPGGVDTATTGADGSFVFAEATAGEELELIARAADGRESPPQSVTALAAGRSAQVDLTLPAPQTFAVRVVGPDGAGLAGAELIAVAVRGRRGLGLGDLASWDELAKGHPNAVAGDDGRAELSLAAGIYDLAARAPGFAPAAQRGVRAGAAAGEEPAPPAEIVLQPTVPVAGQVVDAGGRGVEGAALRLRRVGSGPADSLGRGLPPVVATSGKDGEFSFVAVAENEVFDLVAAKEGYATAILPSAVASGERLRVELSRAGRISGTVRAAGKPLPGILVHAEPADRQERLRNRSYGIELAGRSDLRGGYAVEGLAAGSYQLVAGGRPGLQTFRSPPLTVAAGESRIEDLELAAAAVVFGRVLLPGGEPARAARITFAPGAEPGGAPSEFGLTDQVGGYRLEAVRPGPGWLEVKVEGYRRQTRKVEVREGENQVDLTLAAGEASLAGRVIGPDGEPLAGARVGLIEASSILGGSPVVLSLASRADGTVLFDALDSGAYQLGITKHGYAFAPLRIEIAAGANRLEWRMTEAGARLRGALVGLDPAEKAGLVLRATSAFGAETAGHLEGDGYAIERLAAGRYTLMATSASAGIVLAETVLIGEDQPEVVQDLDFRALAGPWTAEFRRGGEPLSALRYTLIGPDLGFVLNGASASGRIALRAPPGRYRLRLMVEPGVFRILEVELGAPRDQVIDVESLPPPGAGGAPPADP